MGESQPLSLAEWKAAARRGEAPPAESVLRKQYVCDSIKAEGDGKNYTFTISTGAIDRDKDTLAVDGWNVANYLKAGAPVLWAHQSRELPIGKASWVRAQAGALKARVEFAPADVYPFADTVRRLVDFGALKATSVGFLPDFAKAAWNDERGGFDFKGQELLEFSIVPVPANAEALLDAKSAGIDLAPVKAWAEQLLDSASGPGLWLPKDQAAAALKALAAPRIFVPVSLVKAVATKAGRTISAANEQRLTEALSSIEDSASSIEAAAELIEEVLDLSAPPADEPEPAKAFEPFVLVEPAPVVPTFLIDPNHVRAAMVAAVSDTVRGAVSTARGRLD